MIDDELRDRLAVMSDDELIGIVARHDPDEWRPEVFPLAEELLRERGIAIPEREKKTSSSPAKLVRVATFPNPWTANLALQALEQGGLHPAVSGQYLAGAHPPLGLAIGVDVLVPEPELEAAREVLAAIDRGEASVAGTTEPPE